MNGSFSPQPPSGQPVAHEVKPINEYAKTVGVMSGGASFPHPLAPSPQVAELEKKNDALERSVQALTDELAVERQRVDALQAELAQMKSDMAVLVNSMSDQAEIIQTLLKSFN